MSTRRRSSLSQSLSSSNGGSTSQRRRSSTTNKRPSLRDSVRRSSKRLSQNTMDEVNIQLGRMSTTDDTPASGKERRARRKSRKEDYDRIKDNRSDRVGALQGQWSSHRRSFISEEEELDRLVKESSKSWTCCGATLCCGW
ncbi:expressed unknown protein [Seminavis robusta]|uniref:Uncharacterized protein n=1 Tax=Seminavis robusta TaxID=568900 RepID=A0A9N8H813_9STRA|nr:expressed unknown protein [Seminavis robusta]|eukprot:Sro156_g070800.1 n/a (141) ;mRNA; f:48655-49077